MYSLQELVDPGHTLVLLIDLQNDFCAPGGYAHQRGFSMHCMPERLANVSRFLDAARAAGVRAAFTLHCWDPAHNSPAVLVHFEQNGIDNPSCQPGTWGFQLLDGFKPLPGERTWVKYRYSMFSNPEFEAWLRAEGITTLVVVGFATNVCVESTVREAFMRDFVAVVVPECVGAYSDEAERVALDNIRGFFGAVVPEAEILAAWRGAEQRGA